MFLCIYCGQLRDDAESTLEHVIPQSLGGAYVPDTFKTRRVCTKCNNNLGLFVDASVEKSWIITNWLQNSAMACFNPDTPTSLPLLFLGISNLTPPHTSDSEVCEMYCGPLGEQVFLVREMDDRFYWYAGGNPRTLKEKPSRAYYILTERSTKNQELCLLSLRDSFKGKNVKKICCTKVEGTDLSAIGFSEPDEIDDDIIKYFWEQQKDRTKTVKFSANIKFDLRFIAKIARGISFCLFGDRALEGDYAAEIAKALWHRTGDELNILGNSLLSPSVDKNLLHFTGIHHAIIVTVMIVENSVVMNLNFGKTLNSTIKCLDVSVLHDCDFAKVHSGTSLIIFPFLEKAFELSLLDLIAHNSGFHHASLKEAEDQISKNKDYFSNL